MLQEKDAIRYGSSNQGAMSALHAKYDQQTFMAINFYLQNNRE